MKRPKCIKKDIQTLTTYSDFRQFIKVTKKKTSSSPSGRHYGHYKALLEGKSTFLQVIHGIVELAVQNNVILDRWTVTNTTLLEKNPGTPFIHRLRAIHIVEGDLQFVAKYYYAQKMMKTAEKHGLVSDEQYGGRNNRMAQSAVINKIMYYNISHQLGMGAAFMDDDARACYDRIITPLSSLECTKWGLSLPIANFTTNFIHSQKFHVRTNHGVSEEFYTYDDDIPIQGSGQGLSWAGPRWTVTGDSICKVLDNTCAGMMFKDPTNTITVSKIGDHFVDDRASGVTANTTRLTPLEQLQHDEQKHALLLFSAGHKIALDKCSFYYYDFQRVGTKIKHTSNAKLPGELLLREGYECPIFSIKRLEPTEPHKNLGCHICPSMNQETQFGILRDKVASWAHKINSSPLTHIDRMKAYDAYIEKTLLYVLPTTSFNYQQCQELNRYLRPILLNTNGIQRNCSRTALYSDSEYGGLGYIPVFHLQGQSKIQFFMKHYRDDDTTGKLMKISLRHTQLECGIQKPFLETNFYKLHNIITPTWITNM